MTTREERQMTVRTVRTVRRSPDGVNGDASPRIALHGLPVNCGRSQSAHRPQTVRTSSATVRSGLPSRPGDAGGALGPSRASTPRGERIERLD